ncbi:MAG: helix-turn-helix transcriptional regulator [Methylobacter sp.]
MTIFQVPLTIKEILSKAPANPGLWQLFLAELADALQCDGCFLAIADLGNGGGVHNLYRYNMLQEQHCFESNLLSQESFVSSVAKHPYRVFSSAAPAGSLDRNEGSPANITAEEQCRFGVAIPLNSRYAYCLVLTHSHPAPEPDLEAGVHQLQGWVPLLRSALQKEQWFSLYSQITLLTGRHVAAYIIVDRDLNVLFSDPVFNRIIGNMDCVEIRSKRLAFFNKITEERILALMSGMGCDSVTMQNRCASYDIMVIPARALDNLYTWEFYKKGVALTFTGSQENNPTLLRLMGLYNLTKGEALCALHFIATPSIPDIAAGTHRSTETVRNHIKSIMQKLGVHNQGALMKKLLAIAAL